MGHDWNGAHCLILHTTGRKSGETRKFPLIYGRDGEDYVVVASKGGAPENPGWYRNLVAHPEVKIQVWDKVLPVRARTATAEDKRRVWRIMTAQWPEYDKYQAGTKRDIPVVLLSPRGPSPGIATSHDDRADDGTLRPHSLRAMLSAAIPRRRSWARSC